MQPQLVYVKCNLYTLHLRLGKKNCRRRGGETVRAGRPGHLLQDSVFYIGQGSYYAREISMLLTEEELRNDSTNRQANTDGDISGLHPQKKSCREAVTAKRRGICLLQR